ncbi:calcium/sodium antiporter [Proteiniborus sp. MB09-C3]|uniref:calcium/sodium antiporter n=1 Tax=Proteiniborus sp. MB09-C3 TaxID=3050072 RepID=UPI002552F1C6|nr:calcium/sodium antiporter [Proteiniborus sp. MB09-C3]WIV11762.1 calcium/sodium antiporter [Proteiniborus sp. MB09-C3]
MLYAILLFFIGLLLIIKGGDWFTDSAISLARASGLPEVLIGATIVSFATTLPEAIVSITAAQDGFTTMSVGNAVGSIICNIGLILAFVSIIKPSKINSNFFKLKSILMISYFIIMAYLAFDGTVSKSDSLILIAMLIIYVVCDFFILKNRTSKKTVNEKLHLEPKTKLKIGVLFAVGAISIFAGAELLIHSGIVIAKGIGVPESVIALSIIAVGTSLPEFATAITALKKGHSNISIGNIIGANILNITMVTGISAFIAPLKILRQNILLDFPIALLIMLTLVIPSFIKKKIYRAQSIILLVIYIGYVVFLYSVYL